MPSWHRTTRCLAWSPATHVDLIFNIVISGHVQFVSSFSLLLLSGAVWGNVREVAHKHWDWLPVPSLSGYFHFAHFDFMPKCYQNYCATHVEQNANIYMKDKKCAQPVFRGSLNLSIRLLTPDKKAPLKNRKSPLVSFCKYMYIQNHHSLMAPLCLRGQYRRANWAAPFPLRKEGRNIVLLLPQAASFHPTSWNGGLPSV